MRVLITGATGFIGNHIVNYFLKNYDFEVVATARDKDRARSFEWFDRVEFIPFDISKSDLESYKLFGKVDILIHLSWSGLPNYKDMFHIERNLYENYNFIKSMILGGVKNINVIGTCFEYGMKSGSLSEDLECKPSNPYGLAKDTLNRFLVELSKKESFGLKWIRLFYMYGDGQSKNSIISQLERAVRDGEKVFNMSGGEQLRDYLIVEKIAEYIVKISIQTKTFGNINCCSGEPISIRKFIENYIIDNNLDIELNLGYYPYPDYEPMAFWGDDSKLKSILEDFR
jgi:dTDP-6-deoxy-L-talose 4-dehydrogenase (NAD+)